ncbi:hypothetical protein ACQEVB_18265 [Pseudonocardia sp. CA-107938]|uniref:hypothetical protein n=1 Tax=Pseudonocardia sp. CA-107938 TaxID=3240021 RepID=UPI003D9157B3
MSEPSEWTRPGDRSQDEQREADPPGPDPTSPAGHDGSDPCGPSLEKASTEPARVDPTPTIPNLGTQYPPLWQPPAGQQPSVANVPPASGSHPGLSTPQWQPQRAVRPGVIPLRPLGFGEILDGAISFIRSQPLATIGLSAAIAAVVQLLNLIVGLMTGFPVQPNPAGAERDVERYLDELSGFFGKSMISGGISFLGISVLTGLLIVVLSQAVLGRRMEVGEAWRAARGRLLGLIGVTFLSALGVAAAIFLGFVPALVAGLLGASEVAIVGLTLLGMLGGLTAAIYLWVSWSLVGPVYVLEHASAIGSFRRSRALVKREWWRVLGLLLLATLIATVIATIITVPFAGVAAAVSGGAFGVTAPLNPAGMVVVALGAVIASTLTTPFQAGAVGLIYFDQRMRREGLDITLQRAAQQ